MCWEYGRGRNIVIHIITNDFISLYLISCIYCFCRWLENLPVANKSLTLLPHVREYCKQALLETTDSKKHEGYRFVSKTVNTDTLLKAKHHF